VLPLDVNSCRNECGGYAGVQYRDEHTKTCKRPIGKERKGKWTCIVPIVSISSNHTLSGRDSRPLRAQMWITQCYLQIHHICLSIV